MLKSSATSDNSDYLFTGSRDGTLKRWALSDDAASCSSTFDSHVDWVLYLIQSIPILYLLASVLLAPFFQEKKTKANFVPFLLLAMSLKFSKAFVIHAFLHAKLKL